VRINTDGNQKYRQDLFERTQKRLCVSTKSEALEQACIHTTNDIENKQAALDYLSERLSPAELQDVAEILSTGTVPLSVSVETNVGPDQ
jgi:hypothetical protein